MGNHDHLRDMWFLAWAGVAFRGMGIPARDDARVRTYATGEMAGPWFQAICASLCNLVYHCIDGVFSCRDADRIAEIHRGDVRDAGDTGQLA